ncbi:hypothetical protein WGT02_18485 [Rhizobium sp. T1470]|uniref:hypothetical protein n=1 Tax=unclassified Rhizobium TaxID=2613769 RepID=UPI001AAF3575|nr:hypothetical protein [Rhizobium sp. T1473]MCA0803160.1 hypothetical protein [Rhizobium sp. T1473]
MKIEKTDENVLIRYGAKSTRKAEIEHQYRDGSNTSDKRLELAFIIGELRCCEGMPAASMGFPAGSVVVHSTSSDQSR